MFFGTGFRVGGLHMMNVYFFVTLIPALAAQMRVAYGRCLHVVALRDDSLSAGQA